MLIIKEGNDRDVIADQKRTSPIGQLAENNVKSYLTPLLVLVSFVLNIAFATEVKQTQVVADYSNITTSILSDPHQSGYAVAIYKREDGLLFGDFTFAAGTTEGAGGKLFDLQLEHGRIAFKAQTSAYAGPSKELFEFNGRVQGNLLVGTLTMWNGDNLSKPEFSRFLKLRRVKAARPMSYEVHQSIFQKDPW